MSSTTAANSAQISNTKNDSWEVSHQGSDSCANLREFCKENSTGDESAGRGRTATDVTDVSADSATSVPQERPLYTPCYERVVAIICRTPYDGNTDAIGFALDTSTRGAIAVGGLFLVTAFLHLGEDAAGCNAPEYVPLDTKKECTKEIYGMRPSSLITSIQVAVSVVSSLCMPLVGAIIDYTAHRRLVGQLTAALLVVFNIVYIFLGQDNWFALLLLMIPFIFTFGVHSTATFAYFPELAEDDERAMYQYSASFTVIQFLSMILVLAIVVPSISLLGIQDDSVATAHLSQCIVVAWSVTFFGIAWLFCFSKKPTFAQIPEGSTLLTAGFKQLSETLQKIRAQYPAIKWYLVMIAFVNAALPTVTTVVVTIMAGTMNFSPAEVGIVTIIVLLSTIPGSLIALVMGRLVNPKRSLQLSLAMWSISIIAAALILQGPEQKSAAYVFAVLLGINTGWLDPSERGFYVMIIPKNQDAELMGIYLSAYQIIGWLPPLIFTVMNQAGVSLSINLATLSLYVLFGLVALSCFVPTYEESLNQAKDQEHDDERILEDESTDSAIAMLEYHDADFNSGTEVVANDSGSLLMNDRNVANVDVNFVNDEALMEMK